VSKKSEWGAYCTYCGEPLDPTDYPRVCRNGHATYTNWRGVGVALQPILDGNKTGLLLVRRNIPPFQGGLALPGGYASNDELPFAAASRELEEETGVLQNSDKFTFFMQELGDSHSNSDPRRHMLQFGITPVIKINDLDLSFVTEETKELLICYWSNETMSVIDSNDNKIDLCFPLHQLAVEKFFKDGNERS